jgi:hypothetical protein
VNDSELFIDMMVYNHLASLRMFDCTKLYEFRPFILDSDYSLPRITENIPGIFT